MAIKHDNQNCECGFKAGDVVKVKVKGFQGVACTFHGHPTYWTEETPEPCEACHRIGALDSDFEEPCEGCGGSGVAFWNEPEELEDVSRAIVVMVGDDSLHSVCLEDMESLDELAYCHVCGQIGCGHDGLDRSNA